MKIAVLSDIHSNIVALEEVLKDAKLQNVDEYIVLGDMITDLPFTDEIIDIIKELTPYVIKGNRESYLLTYENTKEDDKWKTLQSKSVSCYLNYTRKDNIEYLRNLKDSLTIEFEGVKIKAVHGSTYDVAELLYFDTPLMDKVFNELKEDILVYGHNHNPASYEKRDKKIVAQVGALGMHNNEIAKPQYTILTCENGNVSIETKTVEYSKKELEKRIQSRGGLYKESYCWQNLCYYTLVNKIDIRKDFCRIAKEKMIKRYSGNCPNPLGYHFVSFDDDIYLEVMEEFKKYFLL